MTIFRAHILPSFLAVAIGAGGAGLAWAISAPAPFLTGPAIAVTLATVAGLPVGISAPLRDLCFLTLGIGIGATVTPEVLATAAAWPVSLLVLTVSLYASILLAQRVLIRSFRFDRITALLAATPGHLSYIVGLSTDLKSDVQRVALVQSVRVLLLTLLVPVLLTLWGVEGTAALPDHGRLSWGLIGLTFAAAAVVGGLFSRVRIPAPYLIAGMLLSALGHGSGATPGSLPAWVTLAAFVVMGSLIGTRFRGITWPEIRASLWAGGGVTLIACGVAALGAALVARLVDLPFAVLLMAFAPGGVEIMSAMAVQLGLEPAFVAAHHVLRLMVLTVLVPILIRAERMRNAPE